MSGFSLKFAFGAALGRGRDDLSRFEGRFAERCAEAAQRLESADPDEDGLGWLALPFGDTSPAKDAAEFLRGYDSVVHAGIGGSALGTLMLNQALLDGYRNEIPAEERGGPKFYVADNPDPSKINSIWDRVKGGTVALVGVSKSGSTAETMAQFLYFRSEMKAKKGASADGDILVVTDPEKGIFRSFARSAGCRVLDLPRLVGGRYSVLSNAGLASAAALGIDIDALLEGARKMRSELSERRTVSDNPAWMLASLNLLHAEEGRSMNVMMPYSSRLESFAEWHAQLWAESLGKKGLGTTPVRALGAIDQHSQVQLYAEGPDDKFYTIIKLGSHRSEVTVPHAADGALSPLSYIGGSGTGEMLGLEAMSTASALVKAGRPVVWLEVGEINEKTIGALVFFYEYVTALTGYMMEINPFDQPGVEQGKRYTYGLMGREGFGGDAEEARARFALIEQRISEISC